jgi:hypothetical protein
MVKELEHIKWPMIPRARKESHIACNPKARISLWLGRGRSVSSSKKFFPAPASLCGKPVGGVKGSHIPPRIAAQSAFPSGPLPGFPENFDQPNWRWSEKIE